MQRSTNVQMITELKPENSISFSFAFPPLSLRTTMFEPHSLIASLFYWLHPKSNGGDVETDVLLHKHFLIGEKGMMEMIKLSNILLAQTVECFMRCWKQKEKETTIKEGFLVALHWKWWYLMSPSLIDLRMLYLFTPHECFNQLCLQRYFYMNNTYIFPGKKYSSCIEKRIALWR